LIISCVKTYAFYKYYESSFTAVSVIIDGYTDWD